MLIMSKARGVLALGASAAMLALVHAAAGHSQAQDPFFDIGVGASVYAGTTGLGVQGALALNNNLSLYGGFDRAELDLSVDFPDDTLFVGGAAADLEASTPYAMIGLHPFGNDIRFGAGVAWSQFEATGAFDYQGIAYNGEIGAEVTTENDIAPMLTAGFVQSPRGGIGFYTEVGALFSGALNAEVTAQNNCGGNVLCAEERTAAREEAEDAVLGALDVYPGFYPILRFGVQLSF